MNVLSFKKRLNPLFMIIMLGFFTRLFLILFYKTYVSAEIFEYSVMAKNILLGRGYVYDHLGITYYSFHSDIFYVFMNVLSYFLFPDNHFIILLIQSLISSLLAIVVFILGKKIWNYQCGLLAAFTTIFHPGILYYDIYKLHPLGLDSLLITSSVASLFFLKNNQSKLFFFFLGMLFGAAILQRPTMIFFIPCVFIWLWKFNTIKNKYVYVGLFIFGIIILTGPLIIRNYFLHDKLLLMTTSAEHFWRGNVPWSHGTSYVNSDLTVIDAAPKEFRKELESRNEIGQYTLFLQSTFLYFKQDPTSFIYKMLKKIIYFWSVAPTSGILYPWYYFYVYLLYYLIIFFFSIFGIIIILRNHLNHKNAFCWLILMLFLFLSISFAHSLFYVEMRHRWALEPFILIFASIWMIFFNQKLKLFCKKF